MILKPDSILTRPPSSLPARERVWLEGVGFCISLADLAFDRLRALLLETGLDNKLAAQELTMALALSDAWSFVDNTHRLGDVIGRGMGQLKDPEVSLLGRQFLGVGREVFELRNAVQHLGQEEATKLEESGVPVSGVVSWAVVVDQARGAVRTWYALHGPRSRRGWRRDASSRAWTFGQRVAGCSGEGSGGGTVMSPISTASSAAGMRARVTAQYFGASSR